MAQSSDKYILRTFSQDDYDEYSSWWDVPPPKSSLPNIGIVIGDMKCVGFLAQTDTDFLVMTWWYCNPSNKKTQSYKALKEYIISCQAMVHGLGKKHLFCYTGKRGMIKLLESLGFDNFNGHLIYKV